MTSTTIIDSLGVNDDPIVLKHIVGVTDQKAIDFLKSVISQIISETPFVREELHDSILDDAISETFNVLNRYKPNFVRMYGKIDSPEYKYIRAYRSRYDFNNTNSWVDIHDMEYTDLHVYTKLWNLVDVANHKNHEVYTRAKDGVVYRSAMYMANNRRSVDMSDLPFNTKGDQHYDEYNKKWDDLVEHLINTTDPTQ